MNSGRLLVLSLLSGVLAALSWPAIGFSPLIFIAWVPLLIVGETIFLNGGSMLKLFGLSYMAFLAWNLGATWWIVNADMAGAIMAFVANTALMAGVFTLYYALRRRIITKYPGAILCILWLGFEYFHHSWPLSWPWLTLGNVFAEQYQLIQWYEYTGTAGGTLWVLLINLAILSSVKKYIAGQPFSRQIRQIAIGLLMPALLSLLLYYTTGDKGKTAEIAIVQPNIDPYGVKFDRSTLSAQFNDFFQLSGNVLTKQTDWLLGPETALVGGMDEATLSDQPRIQSMKELCVQYPKLNILIGAETHKFYNPGEKYPSTVRHTGPDGDIVYDAYNTGLLINKSVTIYHKSKLVPGVEYIPGFLSSLAINLGGTSGTLGMQDERTIFAGKDNSQKAAPSICYESVYGDFMSRYVAGGANFIAIITNDGWWGETPGYKQHLAYARLRAIENRRSVARSANTGVSCFINQRGDITQRLPYWKEGAIAEKVYLNNDLTLFSITGDVLGRASLYFSGLLIMLALFLRFKPKT